ncbi:hypothetical protein [Enterococcus sp. AZ103]|uniref:hypothetical protein n=1 Tax=Enterococcus sp. AZ103 TaxID=2774628 RepID=UPI003F2624E0
MKENKVISKQVIDEIHKEKFRSLLDDINYINTVDDPSKQEDMFILIRNTFSMPFDKVVYDTNLNVLSDVLAKDISKLNEEYKRVNNLKTVYSNENILVGFRVFWYDEVNSYFYESVIIRANRYLEAIA